ncbi:MAG TPA: NUDIX hydrolase, partial [Usitatibacter sp.]|nr:NUDIX hydrolase [Usitatibacter sp.]
MAKPPEFSADFTEETISSEPIYEGAFLKVFRDTVRLPDGATAHREYVAHPGAVMVLAFMDDDTIILERQYRYPKHRHFIEIPAGKLEAGEDALATAQRELIEECGYEAREWWHIASMDP